jgi:DNA invertase Pin-like site-specific DNA recombinase
MLIGYCRISDKSQNDDRQIEKLLNYGCEKIFKDVYTGTDFNNRKDFNTMLDFVRQGDHIVVDDMERFGRDYEEIIENIRLIDKKDVGFIILNMEILKELSKLDNALISKMVRGIVINVLAWAAEQNLQDMKRKQAQGIAIAKKKGIYKGKPREYRIDAPNPQKRLIYGQIVTMLYENMSVSEIAKKTGVTRPTIYKIKKDITSII